MRRGKEVGDVVDKVQPDGRILLNHFWGEETYDTAEFLTDTVDFLHPEVVSVMATSSDDTVSSLFMAPLTPEGKLSADDCDGHSQMGHQQSLSSQFQHWLANPISCLMTREVSHVFCFDSCQDLPAQLEAWNIKELVLVRRNGFSRRLTFAELLTRYCFLAFNFDERVVATRKTAQLLMLRLGIDGVEFGKRKVFLKYYHSEYLAELFKTQYRRIVLVQSAARRYLARRRTEREKCARAARVMLKVRHAVRKWSSFRRVVKGGVKVLPNSQEAQAEVHMQRRESAATEIQRHVRGFVVRRRLPLETRVRLLALRGGSPAKRKQEARQLLEAQGLSGEELASAVDEVEECINNKQTGNIISVAEALRFLPSYIHSLGLEANKGIKNSSDPVAFSETKPLTLPQMPVFKDLAPQTIGPSSLSPARLLDISQFYLDLGPPGGWDAAASQQSRKLVMGNKVEEQHVDRVIKERREEEGRSNTLRPAAASSFGKSGSNIRTGTLGRNGTLGRGGNNHTRQISPYQEHHRSLVDQRTPGQSGGGKNKLACKEDKVARQMNKLAKPTSPGQEVSFSPRLETDPEEEEEGPFRFQAMLRRTNVLPTDSLRRRRGGPPKPMGEEVLRLFGGSLLPPLIAPTAAEVVL